jgi:hypothetical protein
LPDPVLDPILASLSYEIIAMLQAFRDEQSFKALAARFGRDERTVSRQFQDLDQAFWDTQQIHIVERELGSRTYRLTKAGEAFVDRLELVPQVTRAAIEAATAATRRVPVLCTANCLPLVRELNDALPTARSFDIVPRLRRSADIDLSFEERDSDQDIEVSFSSALMSSEQNAVVGKVMQWNHRVEVLPLQLDRIRLLTMEDLNVPGPVTVRGLVESGVTFLTPRGGVSWEFLNRCLPGWWKLRPFQHVPAVDLDRGLKCMASGLVPHAAMVVHGITQKDLEQYELAHVRLYDFAGNGSHHLLAGTGVFHARHETDVGQPSDPYDLIWTTAQRLWSEKERVL